MRNSIFLSLMVIAAMAGFFFTSQARAAEKLSIQSSFGTFACGKNCSGTLDLQGDDDDDGGYVGVKPPKKAGIRDDDELDLVIKPISRK